MPKLVERRPDWSPAHSFQRPWKRRPAQWRSVVPVWKKSFRGWRSVHACMEKSLRAWTSVLARIDALAEAGQLLVGGEERDPFDECLGEQETVERIFVQRR